MYDTMVVFMFTLEQAWDNTFETAGRLQAIWARVDRGDMATAQIYMKDPVTINNAPQDVPITNQNVRASIAT